jgi:RimJ/RimL family protein N-acetyltransferase
VDAAVHVFLTTGRLLFRRFTEADVDRLYELDRDPHVMRFLNAGRPTPRDVIRDEILPGLLEEYRRFAGFGRWAAIEQRTGEFLGWASLRPREGGSLDEAWLGYRLRRPAWGRGYGTEAARALIRKAFTELGRPPRARDDDDGQHRLPARDGEGRPDPGADLPPVVAGRHRRRGARGRRVRAEQSGLGAAGGGPPP